MRRAGRHAGNAPLGNSKVCRRVFLFIRTLSP